MKAVLILWLLARGPAFSNPVVADEALAVPFVSLELCEAARERLQTWDTRGHQVFAICLQTAME